MNIQTKAIIRAILTALAIGCVGFFAFVLILQPFFTGRVELQQNIYIGPLRIQLYGVVLAVAVIAGYWLAMKRGSKYQVDSDLADRIILVAIISGFIGARVYHVISEYSLYAQQPLQAFAVWNGGLSIFGAAFGGLIGIIIYLRFAKPSFRLLTLLDWLAPSLVLGQIIGRFGNFFNYELYGMPTNMPWKMFIPIQFRMPTFELDQFYHPLFLYEAVGSTIILILLLKLKLKTGQLFLLWLFLYNVLRFFLEFLRLDSVYYGNIRVNAVVALVCAAVAVYIWLKKYYATTNTFNS